MFTSKSACVILKISRNKVEVQWYLQNTGFIFQLAGNFSTLLFTLFSVTSHSMILEVLSSLPSVNGDLLVVLFPLFVDPFTV